ncbi:hypothetical protein Val02_07940 [Virgisporangium aliadipatigenens]|uniref:SWIM-type domain-containing protein n=1 Tax=Virgisporangium aliadipatigenens TaxID=741659 RepID=A0A8J3YGQ3_9ACTN|nr:hypothetical protein [Virgisporangium aliadipatigenens]GIJ43908.1 hypothetical protein Val02_07940 [Virgisporangium aliadipatigenens]
MDDESAFEKHDSGWERASTARVVPPVRPRKLAKVPFVELADGRLQGVVSSGSDIARVYVSSIGAGTHGFSCSTNNNRPCGGLGSRPCKHLQSLVDEAVLQHGFARVARYLQVDAAGESGAELMAQLRGQRDSTPAATVFSRFLRHLAYLEVPVSVAPVPELDWFPTGGAR